MGSDAPPPHAGPVVLRVKLRYPDVPTFIDKFAVNVGRVGMFLPTRALQPPGTELRFELRLANEQVVLSGLGRVATVVAPDERGPDTIPGMAIEFQRMTRESRDLVMRLLEYRRERGLGEPALPSPEAATEEAASRDSSEALPMRAPLPSALPAEPPRRSRRPLAELIADLPPAERGAVDLDGDDAGLGLTRARERARALAEHDVDSELAELLRPATPPTIDAAAAAAELARQLGMAPPGRRHEAGPDAEPLTTSVEGTTPKLALARRSSSARGSQPPQPTSAAPDATGPAAEAAQPPSPAPTTDATPALAAPAPHESKDLAANAPEGSRRPRVARPQRLTRPASVFARHTSQTRPPPEPTAAEPAAPPPTSPEPQREPASGFERVLAELEESEPTRRATGGDLEEDPLDRLAMEELANAHAQLDAAAEPRAGDALDLGALGEDAFEILLEEDLGEDEPATPASEPSAESSASMPTWRRTAGFDPLDPPFDTARNADFAPPTIPGRIPTRELDLESALEALDLGADDLPTRAPARAPAAAATPPSERGAARSATAELDDLAIELELDDS